ncbi:hypothetical protein BH20ACT21_BH20ACT21_04090 [soil metagenome]
MEDFVEQLSRGNVEEVKVVLASVVATLAIYQVLLMAVGYGKLRLAFLGSMPASAAHRAVGDTIVLITLLIAYMCISYFGFDDGESDEDTRAFSMRSLARCWLPCLRSESWSSGGGPAWARFLPVIGFTVFALFMITWLTSAGDYLVGP